MSTTVHHQVELNLLACTECGGFIALTANHERSLRESHRTFYCPNGHHQYYPGKSDAERLRDALHAADIEKSRLAQRVKEAEAAENAAVTEVKRLKKRAAAGLCPCCNRTFVQLARHMKTKHPEVA